MSQAWDGGGPPQDSAGEGDGGTAPPHSFTAQEAAQLAALEKLVDQGVRRVLESFDAKLAYDATKQQQIDRLHEELQQHRSDLLARATRPLVLGIIRLHDDIGKLQTALQGKAAGEMTPQRMQGLLQGVQEDVEVLLQQNGIAAYRGPAGDFDPRRQRLVGRVATPDAKLANTVAESVRPGFEQGQEVIEKERVRAYEHDRGAPQAAEAAPAAAGVAEEAKPAKAAARPKAAKTAAKPAASRTRRAAGTARKAAAKTATGAKAAAGATRKAATKPRAPRKSKAASEE